MNILLFSPDECTEGRVVIAGRRHAHLLANTPLFIGAILRVGLLNGLQGLGTVESTAADHVALRIQLDTPPPPALPLKLLLALPRPKMLRRILRTAGMLGIKEIVLLNTYRVDKSYWGSPLLTPQSLHDNLQLGLEQAVDTVMPSVTLAQRFKPFVEDTLATWVGGTRCLLADPAATTPCPSNVTQAITLTIGPEGGFTPYEVDAMVAQGFTTVTLGPRILRVETALPVLAGTLFASL